MSNYNEYKSFTLMHQPKKKSLLNEVPSKAAKGKQDKKLIWLQNSCWLQMFMKPTLTALWQDLLGPSKMFNGDEESQL